METLTKLHWNLQLENSKNKTISIETSAVAYLFGDEYRICFSNMKQKYYFIIPAEEYSEADLKQKAFEYFTLNRNDVSVAKCVRCSKWHVEEGQFCNRCKEALKSPGTNDTYLDIET